MIRLRKTDFQINVNGDRITILRKQKRFLFFSTWVELTGSDTEYGEENILFFNSIQEANNFINNICID